MTVSRDKSVTSRFLRPQVPRATDRYNSVNSREEIDTVCFAVVRICKIDSEKSLDIYINIYIYI